MKLKTCLGIGEDCGLETVGESLYNIDLHAGNIFTYSEINKELSEMYKEATDLFSKTNFTKESLNIKVLEWMEVEDDGVEESELNL